MLLKGNSIAFPSQSQNTCFSFRFHLTVKNIKVRLQMSNVGWKEVGKWFSFIRRREREGKGFLRSN